MQSEVMFAGFGGQGILLIGKILAHTAMEEGHEVAWIPGNEGYKKIFKNFRII